MLKMLYFVLITLVPLTGCNWRSCEEKEDGILTKHQTENIRQRRGETSFGNKLRNERQTKLNCRENFIKVQFFNNSSAEFIK